MDKKRKFGGKVFTEGTTWEFNKKRMAKEDAEKIRRRGMNARVVQKKIGGKKGFAVYFR